jgi:hypothetical protein
MVDVILGAAHMFLPEYEWGQSRKSYFKLDNQLTFASSLTAMKLGGGAILCLFAFDQTDAELCSTVTESTIHPFREETSICTGLFE